ncbi:DNA-binding transcriptional regulator, AcrR family [Salinihabitans flavidus]|uniref:DNA-binding transcriptional regulator, AcrR family n=1 Tax=Salinihabitans flavidus TaxID=569882 RepID=A0A1H8V7L3_9RHOB|nr:TetR/AcrR family transcriptional regulator [Salinihabitans flavidus]SEP11425.1 DNA-binding transcriptional regulator, AcrR family [Salinihabitans flavidus]
MPPLNDPRPHKRLNRAQRAEATRAKILEASIEAVGEYGYAGASIARIADRAGIAQGTFYNYFESRQNLLEQLLPMISLELLEHVREKVMAAPDDPIARERARITGFFEFLRQTPHLFTMLHEGEFHTRIGFQKHVEMQTASYERAMRFEMRRGHLRVTDPAKLSVFVRMLMASRDYISGHFCMRDGKVVEPPDHVIDAYMDFVVGGLFKQPEGLIKGEDDHAARRSH